MPTFKLAEFDLIAKNFDELAKKVLVRHNALNNHNEIIKQSPERAAQLELIDQLITLLKTVSLNSEKGALALTGALLYVKEEIGKEYRFPFIWPPAHSVFYNGIASVIGECAENVMDAETRASASRAFIAAIDDQVIFKSLIMNVSNWNLLPVLNGKLLKNALLTSTMLETGKLVEAVEKFQERKNEKALTREKMSILLSDVSFYKHVNRVKEDRDGQKNRLAKFEKPSLNRDDFVIQNTHYGAKESVFRFFGEIPIDQSRLTSVAANVRQASANRGLRKRR